MTKIYLMRHGFTENPDRVFYGSEFPLSERGKAQITGLCEDMLTKNVSIKTIIASPFRRAQETAAIAAHAFHVDMRTDERLMEWNVNSWFNQPLSTFYATTKYDTPTWVLGPDIETHAHMASRVIEVIHELRTSSPNQDALIVSHREPLVCAVLALQGKPFSEVHQLDFPVASVWELVFDGNRFVSAKKAFDRSEDGHAHHIG